MDDHHFTYITKLKKKAKKERKTASNKPKLEEVFFSCFLVGETFPIVIFILFLFFAGFSVTRF
jgi:hypothetical protein